MSMLRLPNLRQQPVLAKNDWLISKDFLNYSSSSSSSQYFSCIVSQSWASSMSSFELPVLNNGEMPPAADPLLCKSSLSVSSFPPGDHESARLDTHAPCEMLRKNGNDPYIVVCGGCNDRRTFSSVGRIDVAKDTAANFIASPIRSLPPLSTSRCGHFLCVTSSNEIIAIGGSDGKVTLRSSEKYVSRSNKWYPLPNMHAAKKNFAGCGVFGDNILVCGGEYEKNALRSVELLGSNSKNWRTLPPMIYPRHSCIAVSLGNSVYVIGGRDEAGNNGKVHKTIEVLQLTQKCGEIYVLNSWKHLTSMIQARCGAAAVVINNMIYIIGGTNGVKSLSSVEIYDVERNTWKIGPTLQKARSWPSAFIWENKIVVFGGQESTTHIVIDSIEMLDPHEPAACWRLVGKTGISDRWLFGIGLVNTPLKE